MSEENVLPNGQKVIDMNDMNIHLDRPDYYDCKKVKIDFLLNERITVLGTSEATVKDPEKPSGVRKQTVIHLMRADGTQVKTFTGAKDLKCYLQEVATKYPDAFPAFRAKIIKEKGKYYRFVPWNWEEE